MDGVSVVIPTWNGGSQFARTLDMIRAQRIDVPVEIVVVDSQSTDRTVELARAAGARVRSILRATFDHGWTRSFGAALSRGRWIAFLTQDAEPRDANWLRALVDAVDVHAADGAYSRVVPRPGCSPLVERTVSADLVASTERLVKHFDAEEWRALAPFERRVQGHFNNVSSLVRRAAFERLPFPEIPFGEDLAWGVEVLARGGTLVYEPDSVVVHSHESALWTDFARSRQDARLMRSLFGFRNRDGWRDCVRAILAECRRDRAYLASGSTSRWTRLRVSCYGPLLRTAQILGQLAGSYGPPAPAPRFAAGLPRTECAASSVSEVRVETG